MLHLSTKKELTKKYLKITFIFFLLLLGFWEYLQKEDYIKAFKPYYLKGSLYAAQTSWDLRNGRSATAKSQNNALKAEAVPVLLFHGVTEKQEKSDVDVSLESFRKQLIALKKDGWETITLEEFIKFKKGDIILPEKSFLLTFDDGRKDSYYATDPILKSLKYSAVIFVIGNNIQADDNNFYLNKAELLTMKRSKRWDIQPHAYNGHGDIIIDASGKKGHFYSNKQWIKEESRVETKSEFNNRIRADLIASKDILEKELNIKSTAFALPFGDYGQNNKDFPEAEQMMLQNLKEIYSDTAFYQVREGNIFYQNYSGDNDYLGERISVESSWDDKLLLGNIERSSAKKIPYYSAIINQGQGWIKNWGDIDFKDSSMTMNANEESTGSAVFLDGTKHWKDYAFKSQVNWEKGSTLSLVLDYRDNNNYLSFNLTESSVRLLAKENGEQKILKEIKRDLGAPKNNLVLGAGSVQGKMSFLINDKVVLEYENPVYENSYGGIGFNIWDKEMNNASVTIKSIKVDTDWTIDNFGVVDPTTPKAIPYLAESFSQDSGWIKTWGEVTFPKNELVLESNSKTTGASAYMGGTNKWQDYIYHAKIDWVKGSNVILMGRYIDDKNYISLNVSDKYFRIEQKIDNKTQLLKEVKNDYSLTKKGLDIKLEFTGSKATFYLGDASQFSVYNIDNKLKNGGIGLKTWDQNMNNAKVVVKKIVVSKP